MASASPPGSTEEPEGIRKEVTGAGVDDLREGNQSVKGKTEGGNSKWVSVAKDKKSLKKYDVEVTLRDGKHKVVMPDDLLTEATPLWEDFLVGKFLDIAPHIAKVHMAVNKIWKYGDPTAKVEVYDVNATTMRFKIQSQKIRDKVIKRGMWNIAGVPMIVKKWTPKTEEEKQEEEAIPMWVHLRKVPLNMFSWEALSFMTSTVGYPVHLHPETLACSNFEEAKVFVNVDVSKSLPKEIDFAINGTEFTAEFYYPWLPSRCSSCEKWGHLDKVCVMKKKQGENSGVKGSKEKSKEKQETEGKEKNKKNEAQYGGSGNPKEKEDGVSDNTKEVGSSELKGDRAEEGNVWNQVSPDKAGRSVLPNGKLDAQVQISASKYSVLSIDEDEKEEGEIQDEAPHEHEEDVGNMEEEGVNDISETDMLEDEILEQKEKEKEKAEMLKGGRRVQKTKAQDANPRSKRSSRRKL